MDRRDALRALVSAPLFAACGSDNRTGSAGAPLIGVDVVRSTEPLGFLWKTLDPFLFCAHHDDAYPAGNGSFGPDGSLEGRRIGNDFEGKNGWNMYHGSVVPGFPSHPHRGFETVTIVRTGLVDHSDSLGAAARYGQGDVQWLTAGEGIVHAEMFPLLQSGGPNPLELFQIWVNLPSYDKMTAPHFAMLWRNQIPNETLLDTSGRKVEVTVIAGSFGSRVGAAPPPKSWAADASHALGIFTLKFDPSASVVLPAAPAGSNRMLYFFHGSSMKIGTRTVTTRVALELVADADVLIENGDAAAEVLVLTGKPIGEPVAKHGPFVMNTDAEIVKAQRDFQATRFGGWPWRAPDPVHDLEERFARHADGRTERGV